MSLILKYLFIGFTFFSILVFSGCSAKSSNTDHLATERCIIDNEYTPKWGCKKNLDENTTSVIGKGKTVKDAYRDGLTKFILTTNSYLHKELSKPEYSKYSKDDKKTLINNTSAHLIASTKIQKTWKSSRYQNARILVSSTKHEIDTVFKKSIAEYQHTRVLQNCFQTGNSNYSRSCLNKLQLFVKSVHTKEKKTILIEVHTDKTGKKSSNLKISKQRARNVAKAMHFKEKKNSQVYYVGLGESQPLYNSESKFANTENRRLKITVKNQKHVFDKTKFKKYVDSKTPNNQKKATPAPVKKVTSRSVLVKKATPKPKSKWVNVNTNALPLSSGITTKKHPNITY